LQSQVPIADTLGQGRQSLNTAQARPLSRQANKRVVLVPANPPFSVPAVVRLLRPSVVEAGAEVHIVYVILVPRALPVGAPMPEQEARANEGLCEVDSLISGIGAVRHVVRGRNIADAVLDAADRLGAAEVLVGLDDSARADDAVESMLAALREKCPCILTMTQQPLAPAGTTTQAQLQGTAAR
jgi:K+-sensing histidine kinase KdpD